MSDDRVTRLARFLKDFYDFPPSAAERANYRLVQDALWRTTSSLGRAVLKQGPQYARAMAMRAAMRANAAMAVRSREAIELGRLLGRSGARGIPSAVAHLGRAAYTLARLAGRHPVLVLLFAVLVTALLVYSRSATPVRVASAGLNCDCTNVSFGLLTKEFQTECRGRESELRQVAAGCGGDLTCLREKLKLKAGPDNRLVSGEFCNPTDLSAGPDAWPELGGPVDPPVVAEKKDCRKVSGLSRTCAD
jgi:hypothetical protein